MGNLEVLATVTSCASAAVAFGNKRFNLKGDIIEGWLCPQVTSLPIRQPHLPQVEASESSATTALEKLQTLRALLSL